MRMNVRRIKSLLWLSSTLAFAGAGYTFWDIYQGKLEGRYAPRDPTYYHEVLWREVDENPTPMSARGWYPEEAYRATWLARIDGSVKPVVDNTPRPGPDTPTKVEIPPIDEILDVGMVLWSDDSLHRVVALHYKQDKSQAQGKVRRLHYTEGEPLKAPYDAEPYFGKVLRIDPQTVTFAWGEGEATVDPGLGISGGGVPADQFALPAEDDPSRAYATAPPESVEVQPNHWVMGVKDREHVRRNGKQILGEEVNVRTVTPAQGRSFLELTGVAPDSLAARYGFQTGDKIISVNGIPMPSLSAAINWAENNSDLPSYHVVFERAGKQQTKVIYVKENKG